MAAGGLIFHELNLITIGLCSILVGLGVDFGMLLYGSYQSQRNVGVEHLRLDDDELPFLVHVHIAEKVRDDIR